MVRAFGGNVAKCVRIAQILTKELPAFSIGATNLQSIEIFGIHNLLLEITLKHHPGQHQSDQVDSPSGKLNDLLVKGEFVGFPTYHLLFDWLLAKEESLEISCNQGKHTELVRVIKTNWDLTCEIKPTVDTDHEHVLDRLVSAFYRSGLLMSREWEPVAKKLSQFDDVVIGVDTNLLIDAVLSEQLLNSLTLVDVMEYVHTPNWMFIVIPSAVMHEIERASNYREYGYLSRRGRLGFRALQEILELKQSADWMGVSVVISGGANLGLDTKAEINSLRGEMQRESTRIHALLKRALAKLQQVEPSQNQSSSSALGVVLENSDQLTAAFESMREPASLKSASGDMVIRDQFKSFLRQIEFHKGGVFFLTADKTNAALAQTEGLFSIYYKAPAWRAYNPSNVGLPTFPYRLSSSGSAGYITAPVPLGKILYELAVEFGAIRITWGDRKRGLDLLCDRKGESLDHWLFKDLIIRDRAWLGSLMHEYHQDGGLSLFEIKSKWGEICQRLTTPQNR